MCFVFSVVCDLLFHCIQPCAHRWFDSAAGTTRAVLAGSSQLPKQGADLKPYTVRVFTSRLRGAGTDANVAINAIGLLGASGWRELPAHHSTCLQQGQVRRSATIVFFGQLQLEGWVKGVATTPNVACSHVPLKILKITGGHLHSAAA